MNMQEIKQRLQTIHDETDEWFQQLLHDERKGVQRLVQQWYKQKEMEKRERERFLHMLQYERSLYERGVRYIAGVDEVGRGPLAGPVVAAAVILPQDVFLPHLDDSKKLSETKREQLFSVIQQTALAIGIGVVCAREIDELNIYEATKKAMIEAVQSLSVVPEHILIDAMHIPLSIPQTSIIRGDAHSASIAASSIIAKVTRDRMMKQLGEKYPQYGFERHMGYGTKEHLQAIEQYGVIEEHRRSFAPIRERLKRGE
ncbi:ribonuclease HII [Anoxybacillus flavithermus AK1]|uniref:Ribonuclease HII n=2 Tax=Anoxybacillaceae TaxID=3120669 RepID=M8E1N9_9BACL|nr:ribonuclease HII [Anoxybacillus flavithermus AK1]